MDLEILDARPRARRVQFPRTIAAPDTGQVLIFDIRGRGGGWGSVAGGREGDGEVGGGVDGAVAHFGFELVGGVGGGEGGEGGDEPGGGWWLSRGNCVSV